MKTQFVCNSFAFRFGSVNFLFYIMKKHNLLLIVFLCVVVLGVNAKKTKSVYAIGFYNLENLFDTCHDECKNDSDFLPGGFYSWDSAKYQNKLSNMAKALSDMGTNELPDVGCAIIGLAEVENSKVLDDLTAQEQLKARNYNYVHIEGPDDRGIDCALLYNPALFTKQDAQLYPYYSEQPQDSNFHTRGFLVVKGELAGEPVTVIVCHLPSRSKESSYRERGASLVKNIKDSLLLVNPDNKILVMGDMNDDPTNVSIHDSLAAKGKIKEVGEGEMYNPFYNILVKKKVGTLSYKGAWNLFDQIIMTPNWLGKDRDAKKSSLKFKKNEICRMDYLLNGEGEYKGTPKRTFAGNKWLNGYSDHLPVVIYVVK